MIRRGALVAINSSGGKDSQAMTILLARIVLRDQLVVVHAPLREVEWPGTIEHIENTIPSGAPLIFAPVASGKSLLVRFEERDRFPGPQQRYCTRDMKVPPTSTPTIYRLGESLVTSRLYQHFRISTAVSLAILTFAVSIP